MRIRVGLLVIVLFGFLVPAISYPDDVLAVAGHKDRPLLERVDPIATDREAAESNGTESEGRDQPGAVQVAILLVTLVAAPVCGALASMRLKPPDR